MFTTYSNPGTSKGYTGHNMVNDFEVIHMGGRTYNPILGRFMQADPFIQAPDNLQNYNRYSYVFNNPMTYTDPSGYFSLRRHIRNHTSAIFGGLGVQPHPAKEEVRSLIRMVGPGASGAAITAGSYFCGPFYAACVAAGTYDTARAFGSSRTGALRAATVSGASAYLFAGSPSSMSNTQLAMQAMTSYVASENAKLGQALSFVVANWGNGIGAIAQNAAGQYMQYKASEELGRFAAKNGMTLQELNVLLSLNSQLGLAVAGTTYIRDSATVEGFFSRSEHPLLGGLWDINDTLLNAQGLLDAVSRSVVTSGYSDHLTGHSLGAARVNNLYRMGYISSATTLSLPGFAYPVAGSSSYCGNLDAICGGSFMTTLRPGTVGVDSPSWWDWVGRNHKVCSVGGYQEQWGRKCN
ncbi:RHS repeat-associated core domain-containing protein [Chromatiaceae bacterium AAb-1]|nr:RHS repeat-associated core domain-containing protein [Chromatiaceae bacterium AAb-1]